MKKNDNRGFSLVELMVTAGLTSIALLGIMSFMKTRLSEAKYTESLTDIDRTVNAMRFYLLDKEACFYTVGNVVLPSDAATPFPVNEIRNRKNIVIEQLSPGAKSSTLDLEKIELFNTALIGPNSYGAVEVKMTFKRDKKEIGNTIGGKDIVKTLDIMVGTGPGLEIAQCFSSTENAIESAYNKVCEDMGGELDITTKKCQFFSLIRGQHSQEQCKLAGGTIFGLASGNICKIPQVLEIPNGWTPYENWSETQTSSPSDADCDTSDTRVTAANFSLVAADPAMYEEYPAIIKTSCTATGHAWSNTPIEECSFTCIEQSPCKYATCREITRTHKGAAKEVGYY